MKRIVKRIIVYVVVALLSGCAGQDSNPDEVVRKVKVGKVFRADSLEQKNLPGIIWEKCRVDLAFRVAGPIVEIDVQEGRFIKKGSLTARIDPRDYETGLKAARAQYEKVSSETGRVVELHGRKSVTDNEFEKALAGKEMAAANLENAKNQLNDTRLYAPCSGFVQKVNYSEGEIVDAGMPVISLIDVTHYEVTVEIPVSLYILKDRFLSFSCSQPLVSPKELPLKMTSWRKKAGSNQLYKLHLKLDPDLEPKLAPGMDVRVTVHYSRPGDRGMMVPGSAVFEKKGKSFVWIYHPDQGVVKSRGVITGKLRGDGMIQITGGLEENEMIVVAGVHVLRENEKVERVEPVSETNVGGLL